MTVAQATVRESLYVEKMLPDLKTHEPNEETVAAILEGDELARMYCSRFVENEDMSR